MSTKCYKNLHLVIDTNKKLEYTNVRKKKQMIFFIIIAYSEVIEIMEKRL